MGKKRVTYVGRTCYRKETFLPPLLLSSILSWKAKNKEGYRGQILPSKEETREGREGVELPKVEEGWILVERTN